jgi:hypothetical protein
VVNTITNLPWVALPTFLSFPCFHAFKNGSPRTIWDFNSSTVEDPTRMSKPWAMGFCTSTTIMLHISKGIHKLILGQFIELNCLKWLFNWALAKQACLAQCLLVTHLIYPIVTLPIGTTMSMQGGTTWCNNTSCTSLAYARWGPQRGIYGVGREVGDVGVPK